MATAVFAPTTDAASGTVTVSDSPVTVSVNAPSGMEYLPGSMIRIEIQTSDDGYTAVGSLGPSDAAKAIVCAGTYRLSKGNTPVPIGVDWS